MAIGFIFRCFINLNFYCVIGGQALIGFMIPIIHNIQAKFVTDWFNDKEVIPHFFLFVREQFGSLFVVWGFPLDLFCHF